MMAFWVMNKQIVDNELLLAFIFSKLKHAHFAKKMLNPMAQKLVSLCLNRQKALLNR